MVLSLLGFHGFSPAAQAATEYPAPISTTFDDYPEVHTYATYAGYEGETVEVTETPTYPGYYGRSYGYPTPAIDTVDVPAHDGEGDYDPYASGTETYDGEDDEDAELGRI